MSKSNAARIATEKRIMRKTVQAMLAAGYEVSIDNGAVDEDENEGCEILRSTKLTDIMKATFLTDEDTVFVSLPGVLTFAGWVRFIYGNDGHDVINDYTTNLEAILKPVNDYAETQE